MAHKHIKDYVDEKGGVNILPKPSKPKNWAKASSIIPSFHSGHRIAKSHSLSSQILPVPTSTAPHRDLLSFGFLIRLFKKDEHSKRTRIAAQ